MQSRLCNLKNSCLFISTIAVFSSALLLLLLCFCGNRIVEPPAAPLIVCGQNDTAVARPNSERFGFFSEDLYSNFLTWLTSFTNNFGTKPAYLLWFQQIDDAFPGGFVSDCKEKSIYAVISLNIMSQKRDSTRNDTLLREITGGLWDSTLAAFAMQARQTNAKIFLRFGYEMNGSWFPWGKKPGDFIAAWNHAHQLFKENQAANVEWIFSPGVLWDGAEAGRDLLAYYPGDSVVDVNSLDGYNYGDIVKDGYQLHWESFEEIFGPSILTLKTLGKPLWITETGCPSDPRRPGWMTGLFAFMDNNPCVETLVWFNDHKNNEPDFRLESDSASLQLIKSWLSR